MIDQSYIKRQQVYGSDAAYKRAPDEDSIAAGVVPLDTLPAQWWNWLWEQVTSNDNNIKRTVDNILNELLYIISKAEPAMVPEEDTQGQLYTAIFNRVYGATGDLTDLTTTAKDSLVSAINEVKADAAFSAYVQGTTLYVAV